MPKSTINIAQGGSLVAVGNPLHTISASPTSTSTAGYAASATKTRPADTPTYTAYDVVAESASTGTDWDFASIGPSAGKILITRARLRIDLNAVPSGMTGFELELYNAAPTAINDDAAYNLPSGDRAKHVGTIIFPTPKDKGDTLVADTDEGGIPIRLQVTLVTGTLFGILKTVGSYAGASATVYTINLDAVAV